MASFEDLKISKSVLKALTEIGFVLPTPIQQLAIPVIKSGQDVIGVAQTGTGKTAAYIIPILMKLVKAEGNDPRVLILVPTRELSIQVGDDLEELAQFTNIRFASVFGGVGWTKHAELIEPGIDILVATPGRLMDLYHHNALVLKRLNTLVIDEADRMLDMGFLPQLNDLLEIIPARRQNMLFSATFSEKIEKMTEEFLDFPERVEASASATPAEQVDQRIFKVPNYRSKLNLISFLLQDEETYRKVIIFCKTKQFAEGVFKVIKRKSEGEKRVMHSNKGQTSRLNAINAFKNDEVRILITTDVSARGIDASKVTHVINFDVPTNYDDYVHRIGRTARAGNDGIALTLVNPAEEWHFKRIEKLIRMDVPVEEIPADVKVMDTERRERQEQLREIDRQRKIDDPTFKGAFHEKKRRPDSKNKNDQRNRNKNNGRRRRR